MFANLDNQHKIQREPDKEMTDYGSDDEEYDSILIEAVTRAEAQSSSNLLNPPPEEYQDMDMEMG